MQVLLLVIVIITASARFGYIIWAQNRWDRMIISYLEHKEGIFPRAWILYRWDLCNEIKWKRWWWLDLGYWGPPEGCIANKPHPVLKFEIIDHWYSTHV
jgi:hypothetical protein